MRRVADLGLDLAARHGDAELDRAGGRVVQRERLAGLHGVVVDLDLAEGLVVLLLAGRQVEHTQGDARSAFTLMRAR